MLSPHGRRQRRTPSPQIHRLLSTHSFEHCRSNWRTMLHCRRVIGEPTVTIEPFYVHPTRKTIPQPLAAKHRIFMRNKTPLHRFPHSWYKRVILDRHTWQRTRPFNPNHVTPALKSLPTALDRFDGPHMRKEDQPRRHEPNTRSALTSVPPPTLIW